jgi:hypothetical protein
MLLPVAAATATAGCGLSDWRLQGANLSPAGVRPPPLGRPRTRTSIRASSCGSSASCTQSAQYTALYSTVSQTRAPHLCRQQPAQDCLTTCHTACSLPGTCSFHTPLFPVGRGGHRCHRRFPGAFHAGCHALELLHRRELRQSAAACHHSQTRCLGMARGNAHADCQPDNATSDGRRVFEEEPGRFIFRVDSQRCAARAVERGRR